MSHGEIAQWAVVLDEIGWKDFNDGNPCALRNSAIFAKCLTEEPKKVELLVHHLSLRVGGGVVFEYNSWSAGHKGLRRISKDCSGKAEELEREIPVPVVDFN